MTPQRRTFVVQPHARAGFTVIELSVAMAIMAILLAIFVVAYKNVGAGSQASQTRSLLERLRSVHSAAIGNKAAAQKLYQQQIPYIYAQPVGSAAAIAQWDAVPAMSSDAKYRTALILKALQNSPEAKAIFDEVPTERKRVFWFDPAEYEEVAPTTSGALGPFTLPLDAWGNPIIYVFDNWQEATSTTASKVRARATINGAKPSGGLTDLYSDSAKVYWELPQRPLLGETDYPTKYIRPATYTPFPNAASPDGAFRSPDQLPFWVSAGPDGKYETHDDNLYSFGN
jgi:prepilin-type N-terminal cleavage/methylation domain-containing protein